jgi:phage replisome organizer, putative, N-terminal region
MKERKYVKFRVDMYEDTKFKIIDMKPERDVIHYIWSRIVMLAGKVNLEGELFLSKSIPYKIETLAIEFNRSIDQVKSALEVFLELQMLEVTEDNVYKVINFAKHQNIKLKEKEVSMHRDAEVKNREVALHKHLELDVNDKVKESEDISVKNAEESVEAAKGINLQGANRGDSITDDLIEGKRSGDNEQKDETLLLDIKKNRKRSKKKKANIADINIIDGEILDEVAMDEEEDGFFEGDRPLKKDESVVLEWSFG